MPAEPQELGEPGSDRAAGPPGPALITAAAEPRPEPDPGGHRAARHALRAVGDGTEPLITELPRTGNPAAGLAAPARLPRPEPGAVADLRRRLEQLPFGHPSSPYHDDGERKPAPPRLKHLELAPPAKTVAPRIVGAAASGPPGTSEPIAPSSRVPAPAPTSTSDAESPQPVARVTVDSFAAPAAHAPPPVITPPPDVAAPPPARSAPDGSWSWGQVRLGRDLVRVADDAYDRFRSAEGRDLFGQYGKGGLTPMLQRVAGRTRRGELAPDTARHVLLDPDEFRARFAEMLSRNPDRSPEQLARRVPGTLSYAFLFDSAHYSEGIAEVQEALELQGFQLRARRNTWSSAANRYVLTVWHDPLTDLPFEVQFHTEASLGAQHLARTLPAPPGNTEIADYRPDSGAARRLTAGLPLFALGAGRRVVEVLPD